MNKSFWNWQFQPFSKYSTFETLPISQRSMVRFPPKAEDQKVGQFIQQRLAEKSGQPLDKNSWSARAATVFNLQQKTKIKFWSCSKQRKKLSTVQRGDCASLHALPCKTTLLLSEVFSKQKLENLSTIYQENSRPWATVCFPGKDNTCRHFLFRSLAW